MSMKQARSARGRTAGQGRSGDSTPAEVPGGAPPALAALVDLLGRRFALGLYWHLRGGSLPFRTLAARLDAPEAQLVQRLRELREAGLVEVDEVGEYRLTTHGRRLQGVIEPLAAWAAEWAALSPRQRSPRGASTRGHDEP
ncbi:transcriptional regulator, HxlR family [Frankia torreyi]|uniref:Transcriptional regulator, HxlR family n=1 Tax=Frankia torreyi TaxID=1856 RepID=A0A0D8B7V9_9ACTN|nr:MULTISPECIES: winged helix-turn-helix transcriptional regulator [Frankia]KJE20251.1 transcriptional regulator, HxlR family [Frankia torreyi]KQC37485.1 transcriptional regulator [Frankia sp. ACN1ag]KQM02535.1 transcriptional regulator, HxlR family [Frankia sp. CpI1-P]